ncbi:hypothetical protein ACFXKW_33750 [Streptomyces sp. NPDC059193]|uniref:hypothetical protein n=1 Tax=Streptomyces sp. NPDC059193 TaxID=3346763 RepID=UPI0036C5CBA0
MAHAPVNVSIQHKYAEQLAVDLASNQAEQADLSARLTVLQKDEEWLVTTLTSMSEGTVPQELPALAVPEGDSVEQAPVPKPRSVKDGSGAASAKKASGKKAGSKSSKRKPVAKVSAGPRGTSAAATPALGELLAKLLAEQPGKPLKVIEVHAGFKAAHPEREASQPAVRGALERLVAKAAIERDRRQGVVLYTWPASGDASIPSPEEGLEELAAVASDS